MSLTTRSLRLHLLSVLGAPLPGAKVTLQLSAYQTDGTDVVPLVWELPEDEAVPGDYVGPIWPNTRGDGGTHYDMLVQANSQQLLSQIVTMTEGSLEATLKSTINSAPYPPVYSAEKAASNANLHSDAAAASASLALGAAQGLGDVSQAVSTAVSAAESASDDAASTSEAQRQYNLRNYPGTFDADPVGRPEAFGGGASQTGDSAMVLFGGAYRQKLYTGTAWAIPNPDAAALAGTDGSTLIGERDPVAKYFLRQSEVNRQLRTAKLWGVPSLITSYATVALQRMLNNERQVVLTPGVYKIDEPLYPLGGSPGEPQTISSLGSVEIYQAEMAACAFRHGGKTDLEYSDIGNVTHKMSDVATQYLGYGGKGISDYNSSGVPQRADRIRITNVGFRQIAMQAIINWAGGEDWHISDCFGAYLGREFFFTNAGKTNTVQRCNINMSGDDSLAFAQPADMCSAIGNTIRNAGRNNLGGSAIRACGYGMRIALNIIENPSVFGLALAETSDGSSRPDDIELVSNIIRGLTPYGSNTSFLAAIAIFNALNVKIVGGTVNLAGTAKAYPAIRLYGDKAAKSLSIEGKFTAKNTRDLLYIMGAGVGRVTISEAEMEDCNNMVAVQDSPVIGELDMFRCRDINRANSVVRANAATAATFGTVRVKEHRSISPAASQTAVSMSNQVATQVILEKNEWAGSTPMSSIANVTDLYTDGDSSGKRIVQGTGTIPAGSTSVAITHGIADAAGAAAQPSPYSVSVFSLSQPVAYRVATPGATTFTVAISAALATDLTFRWSIRPVLVHYASGVAT